MLRDENDHLKASTAELTKSKSDLEAELVKARLVLPLAAQAQTLREQLAQIQSQAAALADENSKLKARLAVAGGAGNLTTPAPSGNAPGAAQPPAKPAVGGVTATFVTNVPGPVNSAGSSANAAIVSAAESLKTRTSGTALRFHTVTTGDTLSKISNTYYGTPTRWAEILVANRDILGEDNNLVIGRTLRIP
jgi:nucleoid-associated protein YgaU